MLSSFLLGGPSGSGVATTVTLGTVAYPMLAKAGYERNAAGGLLAAGGLGAILSPPVLGAAAFLIAEFLKISYLDVIKMAAIPTCLYYLSLLLMVEIDARKYGMQPVDFGQRPGVWELTRTLGFHFLSLVAIIVFMLLGFSPIGAVVLGDGGRILRRASSTATARWSISDSSRGARRAGGRTCCCGRSSRRRSRPVRSAC